MTIYFATRSQARNFAKTSSDKKSLDKKVNRIGKQWPVTITKG